MLKFKTICILFVLIVYMPSCQKNLLETIPDDRISSNIFWNTENDAILASNAAYGILGWDKSCIL